MNLTAIAAFESAEREYNDAWNAPSSTRFELPPVDVNKTLKERYRVSADQGLTRTHDLGHGDQERLGSAHLHSLCGFACPLLV